VQSFTLLNVKAQTQACLYSQYSKQPSI